MTLLGVDPKIKYDVKILKRIFRHDIKLYDVIVFN